MTKEDLVPIRNNGMGYSMEVNHFMYKGSSNLLCCKGMFESNEMVVFAQMVHYAKIKSILSDLGNPSTKSMETLSHTAVGCATG